MRNGNRAKAQYEELLKMSSYRTYEEWKLNKDVGELKEGMKFLPYL